MNAIHKIVAVLFVCIFLAGVCPSASASEADIGLTDWDTVSSKVIAEYGVNPDNIRAGYLNLVTGEEHYINGDEYSIAASMYKVPLCMYFSEHLADGSLDWSDYEPYFSYESVQNQILIESSNEQAIFLFNTFLGSYEQFRALTADYTGSEISAVPADLLSQNYYTAREFIHCLQLLYNETDRFPGVLDAMRAATPAHFFTLNEPRFRIAHKPGWAEDYGFPILNDCAVCFTTQPIALVLFTRDEAATEEFLSAWCTAMCEYTERLANRPSPPPVPEPTSDPAPLPTAAPAAAVPAAVSSVPARIPFPSLVPAVATALFLLVGFILILFLCIRYRARFIGLFLALLISASAMLMAGAGIYLGTIYAKPSGSPSESAAVLLDALCAGDYDTAYRQLYDYADLGLSEVPASPAAQIIYTALHDSYSYSLSSECRIDKLSAVQPVSFTYLDLARLEEAAANETQHQIELIVQTRAISQVYDENKRYKPEVANEAYLAALNVVLQNASDYYAESSFDLSLTYADSRWQVITSSMLLRALSGGIA